MVNLKTYTWQHITAQQQAMLMQRPVYSFDQQLKNTVKGILAEVNDFGDQALKALTAKFDGVKLNKLILDKAHLERLSEQLPQKVKDAINCAYQQIECFHLAQKVEDIMVETAPGIQCQMQTRAIGKVGLYIPGGSAPLPSTVLMLGVPSKIAGNKIRVLCTPPNKEGLINPAIAYAALVCGIDRIYLAGGAQAIAAMAYGTETIPKVDKIFGPGNSFVTMAKQLINNASPATAIDMPAGPSEVLVIADENANAGFIAADLLSQAEHGPDSQVVLVCNSSEKVEQVRLAIIEQLEQLPREDIAAKALLNSALIITESLEQSIEISNRYAPEHLIIQTESPETVLESVENAASIFVGPWSPESAGDYASGTNHVLPTYGYGRALSSLGLADFNRRFTIQTLSKQGLQGIGQAIIDLAEAEGLQAHANAVAIRLAEK